MFHAESDQSRAEKRKYEASSGSEECENTIKISPTRRRNLLRIESDNEDCAESGSEGRHPSGDVNPGYAGDTGLWRRDSGNGERSTIPHRDGGTRGGRSYGEGNNDGNGEDYWEHQENAEAQFNSTSEWSGRSGDEQEEETTTYDFNRLYRLHTAADGSRLYHKEPFPESSHNDVDQREGSEQADHNDSEGHKRCNEEKGHAQEPSGTDNHRVLQLHRQSGKEGQAATGRWPVLGRNKVLSAIHYRKSERFLVAAVYLQGNTSDTSGALETLRGEHGRRSVGIKYRDGQFYGLSLHRATGRAYFHLVDVCRWYKSFCRCSCLAGFRQLQLFWRNAVPLDRLDDEDVWRITEYHVCEGKLQLYVQVGIQRGRLSDQDRSDTELDNGGTSTAGLVEARSAQVADICRCVKSDVGNGERMDNAPRKPVGGPDHWRAESEWCGDYKKQSREAAAEETGVRGLERLAALRGKANSDHVLGMLNSFLYTPPEKLTISLDWFRYGYIKRVHPHGLVFDIALREYKAVVNKKTVNSCISP